MIHVMADIETWGTQHNALIWQIGGVKFDADTVVDRFTVAIDPIDAQRMGRHIDAAAILYWFEPKRDAARKELLDLPKIDLYSAVDGFVMWCNETYVDQRGSLWGKGSTFDNVLLRDTADALLIDWPFTYRQDECYRTMANRCPEVEYVQIGTAHNAVADAESQAVHLQAICKKLGIAL